MKFSTRKKYILYLIGILVIIIMLKYDIGIPCIFHIITGYYCPGCGGTRAIRALAHFNIHQAFRYNALIVLLFPFAMIYLIYKYVFKGRKSISNNIWLILLIITILFSILRNIPMLYILAPTKL